MQRRGIKLIVQIPCYNEEDTLARTVSDIPRHIRGIDLVEIMVIDDGSRDATVQVARDAGVEHILSNKRNLGLARSFQNGLQACLKLGADIIVNTDGDNQYHGPDIVRLVKPILDGTADIVIGDRQIAGNASLPARIKLLQVLGSWTVRKVSGVEVTDAVCGFQALSRDAAFRINIASRFSYTIEMLIQAGAKGLAFTSVPIRTNPKTRDSRLFRSVSGFIGHSALIIIRMYALYRPVVFFNVIGTALAVAGTVPIVRFIYEYAFSTGAGRIQSLVLGAALLTIGMVTFVIGMVADVLNHMRQAVDLTLERVTKLEVAVLDGAEARTTSIRPSVHSRGV